MDATVFVTGATGAQGFGVVRALSASPDPPTIHALVRDPKGTKAQELHKISDTVKLLEGTFDDPASIANAVAGCTHAFINLVPTFQSPELELAQLKNILSIFLEQGANPKYVIYSCGIGSERDDSQSLKELPGSSMFRSFVTVKHNCHKYTAQMCEARGVQYTILQPGYFFSNWLPPVSDRAWPSLARTSSLSCAFRPDIKLPCLDQSTLVGDTVAALIGGSITNNKVDLPRALPLASELLTIGEIAATMTEVLQQQGKNLTVEAECLSEEEAIALMEQGRASPMMASHFYHNEREIKVDLEGIERLGITPKSFEDFLIENFDRLQQAVGLL